MKYTSIAILFFVLATGPVALLHAESNSGSNPRGREEMREQTLFKKNERFEHAKEKMEMRRDHLRARFDEKRVEVIASILDRMEDRFQKAIDRTEDTVVRVQARIDLLEDEGIVVTEAQASLDAAQDSLAQAQEMLESIDLEAAVASTTRTESFKDLREKFATVKGFLKSAHEHLIAAITVLKKESRDTE